MFDLNDSNFGNGNVVFNNGMAGKVENVKVSIEKKKATDPDNTPDYKIVVTDNAGGSINQGFYYYNEASNKPNNEKYLVQRVLSAARAIVPADVVYPEIKSSKEAVDVLFKYMAKYAADATVNVYVTYGTLAVPSRYMGLRYFNFIEKAGISAAESRLKPASGDNLIKVEPDTENIDDVLGGIGTSSNTKESEKETTDEFDW